ncbi:hypothetical protein FHR83_007051 [Actinoplanes campanulatus]|uniref:Uncharacterized protein n=1 Tax=Actinoplanes campanulatus TaxID=113559 RepID=A0A7W5ANE3_9ACTN|nr:hypothetical protein [Actinoplanes campanulatus]MBB3099345.1 hypothetical protein [Actinoplanes campanulatus]GGN40378.1 hypothetical protein GCM10010109_69410 [Actinoplanes campanulatus]GID40662.1 hypothetical protein Aca09nite_71680 [Actinoplanes campanulatus]
MKTFPNWRAVGRAMRWARQQKSVTAPRFVLDNVRDSTALELAWKLADGREVEVWRWRSGNGGIDLTVKHKPVHGKPELYAGMDGIRDAAEVLRVLAALDLIPADIAYAADERYGRCVRCGLLARWWPAEAEAGERWVHVTRLRFDLNPHPAEVAG